MLGIDDLKAVLREHYGVSDPAPCRLAHSWEGKTFHQPCPGSAGWVVRILNRDRAVGDAQALLHLEQVGYLAPRLVRTLDGDAAVTCGACAVIVTTFVPGAPADLSPRVLYQLGQRLGQLHTLNLPARCDLPQASMLPATDMATALDWLCLPEPLPSPDLEDIHKRLLSAIRVIAAGEDLPHTLIHNDAHPGNAVVTADGTAVFIDWSGAGLGPPMVDLGFLLVSSEIAISWAAPIPPAAGRIEAIVDGYACYRVPTRAELEWLPDAIRFRGLLYGAGHLANAVAQGRSSITEIWWWERYLAADALADRVWKQFQRRA